MSEKVFVLPKNDLEAVEIAKLLKDNGLEEGKDFFITEQAWGASWEGLEDDIKEKLAEMAAETVNGEPKYQIYGVELGGDNPYGAINIDHHGSRPNAKSSIAQVADVLGKELTLEQELVSANDVSYIKGINRVLDEHGYTGEERDRIFQHIRLLDRQAQGITEEHDKEGIEAFNNREHANGYDVVHMSHSHCASVTDPFYGQYENLLFICGDGEVDFYGDGEVCHAIYEKYNPTGDSNGPAWLGGDALLSRKDPGYSGISWSLHIPESEVRELIENELAIEGLLNDEADFAKNFGASNIDHHNDRTPEKSAIEQVTEIVDAESTPNNDIGGEER
jgi:hypothetical protein